MQTSKGMLCARNGTHYVTNKYLHVSTSTCRPVVVRALGSNADGTGSQAQKLFQQHKVLLGAGFSYDQAALILQVSQQRKATPTQLTSAGPAAVDSQLNSTSTESMPAPAAAAATTDSPTTDSSAPTSPPAFKTLEDRIAFLELELLKQSLVNPLPATVSDFPADLTSSSSPGSSGARRAAGSSLAGTAAALNPTGAGAGGLNAAAAAAANRWNADSSVYRQHPRTFGASSAAVGGQQIAGGYAVDTPAEAVSISNQLAVAAELGQLDPEVYAIAEALAVRQGFAALPVEPQPQPYTLNRQQRRPAGIWGRSGVPSGAAAPVRYARPLSANAWGVHGQSMYDAGYGDPLLKQQDLEEEVPYQPSGLAVAGTIVVVYLGVIATFLLMCIGDVPY